MLDRDPDRLLAAFHVQMAGAVIQGQEAAWCQCGQQAFDDRGGFGVVDDVAHDPEQDQRDRAGKIQDLPCLVQDLVGVADIAFDVTAGSLRAGAQQRPGVHQYERVVVHVHDFGLGGGLLGYLVGVADGGQAGADVDELADALVGGEVVDHAAQAGA